eukprot:scaffold72403_cov111-Phaeocystis_antarctica.AAC.3
MLASRVLELVAAVAFEGHAGHPQRTCARRGCRRPPTLVKAGGRKEEALAHASRRRLSYIHLPGEPLLGELPLVGLLLDGARAEEAVDVARLLLTRAPHARESLLVVGGVPVGVEEDEPVGADQVEAAAARLGGE